ncbi:mannan endo-1,4-beta-mannosidase [Winogradskyella pacifica]|uniref:mannan endo-1,4-beta-mannosidase n=1 Tax=Winogradskyella pacifica TaxID=664642 RepID=A0A3D9NAK9_9FLAO|nr:cellulase family glycosylhydrolase [Winogradskyella pacifica]REE27529.1 mannan endo-1,4-beta-mannosidase [Winogradskyella pacifica]
MKNFKLIITSLCITVLFSCKSKKYVFDETPEKSDFITVKGTQFQKGDQPYYFIGANYWYGPLIGAKKSGDRERLIKELDLMKSVGIDNLRILVGGEGDGGDSRVYPALQPEQGVYNEDLLDGLDFLLAEMRQRNMYAVLYLNNNWIWSGGMSEYLKWNGYGDVPNPFLEAYSWDEYMNYTKQFHSCEPCKDAFYKHIKFIISRTNSYTNIKYVDDPSIMSWQVANEPRVLMTPDHEDAFAGWLNETVRIIKELAPNQLISTGTEGKHGFLQNIDMYQRLHKNENIDYLTMHMWPKNWGWYDIDNEKESTQVSIVNAKKYMNEHVVIANKLNKPIVMSEFGFPREKESLSPEASIENRNTFYKAIFEEVQKSKTNLNPIAGLNFWGFAGYAITDPNNGKWKHGDDFTADPPQEPQGLNSVFASDISTLELIKTFNLLLTKYPTR